MSLFKYISNSCWIMFGNNNSNIYAVGHQPTYMKLFTSKVEDFLIK